MFIHNITVSFFYTPREIQFKMRKENISTFMENNSFGIVAMISSLKTTLIENLLTNFLFFTKTSQFRLHFEILLKI
jgi:hypothetical protein